LLDTIDTCRIICFRERNRQEPDKSRFIELQRGIKSFANFLIAGNFRIEDAVIAASKIAYLNSKLLSKNYFPLERYKGQDMEEFEIKNQDWNVLNRLKRFSDQTAFFYWYNCLETLELHK
jgi:hypothetical protein